MNPFSTELPRSTHQGNVPVPDCWSTFGALGADASCRTAQRGVPLPVTPCSQAAGSVPGVSVSKLSVCAIEEPATSNPPIATIVFFIRAPIPAPGPVQEQNLDAQGMCDAGSLPAPPFLGPASVRRIEKSSTRVAAANSPAG